MALVAAQVPDGLVAPNLQRLPSQVFTEDSSPSTIASDLILDEAADRICSASPETDASSLKPAGLLVDSSFGPSSAHAARPALASSASYPPPTPEERSRGATPTGPHRKQRSTPPVVRESQHGRLSETFDGEGSSSRRLNEYTIHEDVLGKGSFGSVQVAKHDQGEEYAIKEYSKSRLRKRARSSFGARTGGRVPRGRPLSDGLEAVKVEIAILKKCSHPNLCSLLEVIDTDGDSLFYVLDLCRGGPVINVAIGQPAKPLSPTDARNVMRQVVLGLEYLHGNSILHRDIKPDNILYVEDSQARGPRHVKIVDFGTSEMFVKPGDDTTRGSAGSPAFMAPEVCAGNAGGAHGKSADVWSCGVTLFAIVAGYLPWEETQLLNLSAAICNEPVRIPPHVSADLSDLIDRMLHKDPADRIVMDDIRIHPWLTESGPLPSKADNVSQFEAPSEEEIAGAIRFRATATILKAVSRFKRRSTSDGSVTGLASLDLNKTPSPRIEEELH